MDIILQITKSNLFSAVMQPVQQSCATCTAKSNSSVGECVALAQQLQQQHQQVQQVLLPQP